MLKSLSRAFSQSFDPAFRRVFNRSLLFSLVTFIVVWLASWFALDWAGEWLVAWVRDWAGEGFWLDVMEWLVDIAAVGAIAIASLFLFPAVMVSIMAMLLDDIAQAVERRYYPDLPPARPQPLAEAIFGNL
ncbi:MAG: EI24 domain-containing protein, partial [Kiloniellaceae bacterium]